jgi:hypothetical protein
MKKIISAVIILLLFFGCAPNISLTQLKSDFTEYSTLVSNGEYEKVIEFMPTEFWNVYDKNEFLAKIKKRIKKQIGSISINNIDIKNVSKTIKSNNKYFRVITYSSDLEFDSSNTSDKMLENYKSKFGAENVKLDTINKLIKIKNNSQMISVYEDKLEKWKYLEIYPQSNAKIYGIETWTKLIKYVR